MTDNGRRWGIEETGVKVNVSEGNTVHMQNHQ